MNALGKRARAQSGLNRTQLRFVRHTRKSDAARRRKGWGKAGTLPNRD